MRSVSHICFCSGKLFCLLNIDSSFIFTIVHVCSIFVLAMFFSSSEYVVLGVTSKMVKENLVDKRR